MSNGWGPSGFRGAESGRQFDVLVIQSNPLDTFLTMEAFKIAGVTDGLHCVGDGEDAIKYVLRKGQYRHAPVPDLIFVDLSQPKISRLDVLKVIKSTPELLHIPIVVAAGSDDPQFVKAVYELNGSCFIKKPNQMSEFFKYIETCYQFWGTVVTLSPQLEQAPAKRFLTIRKF
jgi:CheY-like chemotaxis protein